jgi:hypothetical protein
MPDDIRARLECADELDQDERLKTSAEAMLPVYACDLLASPHEAACRLSPRASATSSAALPSSLWRPGRLHSSARAAMNLCADQCWLDEHAGNPQCQWQQTAQFRTA